MQAIEQFLTIQGEGRSVGKLAYFIRLAGCNLWCRWCDSMNAVDPIQFRGKTFPIDYGKIPADCPLVVLTGGEPTLFNLNEIRNEVRKVNSGCVIEVESNGTVFPVSIVDLFLWNISPKLTSSDQKSEAHDQKRLLKIQDWSDYAQKKPGEVIFKFVISSPKDLDEVLELVADYGLQKSSVYLMAQGATAESQSTAAVEYLIDAAMRFGFNFSPRLHVQLWGDRRGV